MTMKKKNFTKNDHSHSTCSTCSVGSIESVEESVASWWPFGRKSCDHQHHNDQHHATNAKNPTKPTPRQATTTKSKSTSPTHKKKTTKDSHNKASKSRKVPTSKTNKIRTATASRSKRYLEHKVSNGSFHYFR